MRKKTHGEFIKELSEKRPDIECLEEYTGRHTKITFKHTCGYIWKSTVGNILQGYSICPKCTGHVPRTHYSFIAELATIHPNLQCLEIYVNQKTKLKFECLDCGYQFRTSAECVLRSHGTGCKRCAMHNLTIIRTKTHSEFITQMSQIHPTIICLGVYVRNSTPVQLSCTICSHIWFARPYNSLLGKGCPNCNKSTGERIIENWLNLNAISFIPQKTFDMCYNIFPLSFDFFVPILNICIEYQGIQHYTVVEYFGGINAFEKQQERDNIKRKYCQDNNISLLEIKYDEDIEKVLSEYFSNTKYSSTMQVNN